VVHGWTTKSLPPRALRLAPILCAVLAAALALPATRALAVGDEPPTIERIAATNISTNGATVEALINPQGNTTTYEIWLVCQHPAAVNPICEEPTGGSHLQKGYVGGIFDRTVSDSLTGLREGYQYVYEVSAASTAGSAQTQYQTFETARPASCPNGCSPIEPYESKMTPGAEAVLRGAAEEAEARQRGYVEREAKERAEREAAAKASQQSIPAPPVTAPSSVSLASSDITVESGHVSLIQLECLGAASCNGRLTLSAKIATKAKGTRRHSHTIAIGTADFSISGDETEAVKLDINATGRRLLGEDHGHLAASLAILELAPSPESTLTKAVQLTRQQTRVKRSR
jgi:hypothetical protein